MSPVARSISILVCASASVCAQAMSVADEPLEEVVVTATLLDTPLSRLAASVSILDADAGCRATRIWRMHGMIPNLGFDGELPG